MEVFVILIICIREMERRKHRFRTVQTFRQLNCHTVWCKNEEEENDRGNNFQIRSTEQGKQQRTYTDSLLIPECHILLAQLPRLSCSIPLKSPTHQNIQECVEQIMWQNTAFIVLKSVRYVVIWVLQCSFHFVGDSMIGVLMEKGMSFT